MTTDLRSHPAMLALRRGADESEGHRLIAAITETEALLDLARQVAPSGDGTVATRALQQAQVAIDGLLRLGQHGGGPLVALTRWHETTTRELLRLAIVRWGSRQTAVQPLGYTTP